MAKTKKGKKSKKASKGFMARTSSGLDKKNYRQKGGNSNRVIFKEGGTLSLQFLELPKKFKEFDLHQFREGKGWASVPCAGEDNECPLCEDDDDDISKTRYQFVANVYNFKEKKVQVLRGGKDMAGKVMLKYGKLKKKGSPKKFIRTVYDITQMPGNFTTYDIDSSDETAKNPEKLELIDLDAWLAQEMKNYYGDDMPGSSLDDDDDDDEDDDDDD